MSDVRLHLGDCLDFLRTLPDGSVDAVVTDAPYGLGIDYASYDDTQENLATLVNGVVPELRRVSPIVAITTGVTNIQLYPRPDWILCWACSGAGARGKWGFSCWQPILVYGPDPFLRRRLGARPDLIYCNAKAEKFDHPCPKPLAVWTKVLERVSPAEGETILDPFMGSGTTGVACVNTGRNFIGCEIDPGYFAIAEKRIEAAKAARAEQLIPA
jgi:DNA modification methylase